MNGPFDDTQAERVGNAAALVPPPRRERFVRQVCDQYAAQDRGTDGDANTLEVAIHTTLREVHALREEFLALGAIVNGNQE